MILIVTNKNDFTVDYFISKIKNLNIEYFRFNTEEFLTNYTFEYKCIKGVNIWSLRNKINNKIIESSAVSGIWYRRPVLPEYKCKNINNEILESLSKEGFAFYESIINSNIDKYNWVSNPYNIRKAENKILQSKIACNVGFLVPNSMMTNDPEAAKKFIKIHNKCCIKPLNESILNNDENSYIAYTAIINKSDINNIDKIKHFPIFVQQYIDKEYELRITVIGDKVIPVAIHSQTNKSTKIDWRVGNCKKVKYTKIEIPDAVSRKCLAIVKTFGLKFSSMDLIFSKDGKYYFLDLNPNGQWAWIDIKLNLKMYKELLEVLNA